MVAVSASAHSLDALYAELADLVAPGTLAPGEKVRRHGRWAEVAGILALAFDLDLGDWRPRLKRLFELRNAAVHPKMQWVEPQKHPAPGLTTASARRRTCSRRSGGSSPR
jgi:hypothetical protein